MNDGDYYGMSIMLSPDCQDRRFDKDKYINMVTDMMSAVQRDSQRPCIETVHVDTMREGTKEILYELQRRFGPRRVFGMSQALRRDGMRLNSMLRKG